MNFNRNFNRSSSLVGLDIQPDAIRLVRLKKIKRGFQAKDVIENYLPNDVFAEGKIKNWELLRSILVDLVNIHQLNGMPTAISLPVNLVRIHQMQMPHGLSEAEIEIELFSYIHNHLPGLTDSLSIDFVSLPQKQADYNEIFFAATRKEYLSSYIDCVNAAGLKVKIVDVDIYALKRAISQEQQNRVNGLIQDQFLLACGLAMREVPKW